MTATIGDQFDVLLFTSVAELECVLEVARVSRTDRWRRLLRPAVRDRLDRSDCGERLREHGLQFDVEAVRRPRMGQLVVQTLEADDDLTRQARSRAGGRRGGQPTSS